MVQKVGRRIAENFNLKGLHRLDINDYLSTFFLFGVINVVYFFYVCIILYEALLPCNSRKVRGGDSSHFGFLPPVRFRVS